MADERFFTVTLSEVQHAALESAGNTCAEQWDGSEPDDIAEQDALWGALAALQGAEEVR